ncbi:ABC transporter substrate-binding protein [Hahella aquimaris]|uniref:substrate-binding periplasmic protein n=1 Tax=Hahella sp. HNIBRBA332 TaxID=3015983 RepID=UPI00273C74AB|nr:ABC transporter substrate-binding protein [Hahella sp. HNIBRBA332]WLQ11626.1 ABC transporter substrate-binding protein [Hahella sp. HNIBRBA332]
MNRRVTAFLGSIIVTLAATFCGAAETITISTGDYSPWAVEKSTYGGYVNRLVREAFKRKNIKVEFVYLPWKRAYEEVRTLRVHASSFWFFNEERNAEFYQVGPVSWHNEVFFHLKSNPIPNWSKFSDLKPYRVGATIGYTYSDEFWNAARSNVFGLEETARDDINFRKLLRRRIDLFPIDEMTGWRIVREQFDPGMADLLTTLAKPLTTTQGFILFSRAHPDSERLSSLLTASLEEMDKAGVFDSYMDDMLKGKF